MIGLSEPAGVEVGTGYITIIPSARGFMGRLNSQIGGDLDRSGKAAGGRMGKGMSAGLGGMASKMVAPVAAAFAGVELVNFLQASFGEATDAVKVGNTTAQIIKQTGGAAKVTESQVGALAERISKKTAVDDEAIQTGSNLLLTFKNVRNEAGEGGKIFDRATMSAVDLSKAGFGSIDGSAKMLGKALNDPIKGISALGRAGVTFTDQQKEQIKTLTESGDVLGAQKIILAEVESQVGGVAAATATAGDKWAVAWGNIQEQVGTALMPLIDQVVDLFLQHGVPAITAFVDYLSGNLPGAVATTAGILIPIFSAIGSTVGPILSQLVGGVGGFVSSLSAANAGVSSSALPGFMAQLGAVIQGQLLPFLTQLGAFLIATLVPAIQAAATFVLTTLLPALAQLGIFVATEVLPRLIGIGRAIQGLLAVVAPIIGAILGELVAQVNANLPTIMSAFGSIRAIVVMVLQAIQTRIQQVTTVIRFIWSRWGGQITALVGSAFRMVVGIISGALKVVEGIIQVVTGVMTGDWRRAGEGLKNITRGVWQVLVSIWNNIRTQVTIILGNLITQAVTRFRGFLGFIGSTVRAGLARIADFFLTPLRFALAQGGALLGNIRARFAALLAWAGSTLRAGLARVKGFITDPVGTARSLLNSILSQITTRFGTAVSAIGRAWDGLKEKAKAPIRFVVNTVMNGLVGAFNKIAGVIPGVAKLPDVRVGFATGGVERRARGILPGRSSWHGGDTHLRPMREGEGVTVSEALDPLEEARLLALNAWVVSGKSPASFREHFEGYAVGGRVSMDGEPITARMAATIRAAEKLLKYNLRVVQGSWQGASSYSGTSHTGPGVADIVPGNFSVQAALRRLGWAAWARNIPGAARAGSGAHVHGILMADAPGNSQVRQFLNGGDGLGGKDYGPGKPTKGGGILAQIGALLNSGFATVTEWLKSLISKPLGRLKELGNSPLAQLAKGMPGLLTGGMLKRVASFDTGGWLEPGLTLAHNGTGAPERVGGPSIGSVTFQSKDFDRDLDELMWTLRTSDRGGVT